MTRFLIRFFASAVDHPFLVSAFLLVLTVVATIARHDPSLIRDPIDNLFANDNPAVIEKVTTPSAPPAAAVRTGRVAGGVRGGQLQINDNDVVMIIQSDEFFSSRGSEAISTIVDDLRSLSIVDQLFWMGDTPPINLFALRDAVLPKPSSSEQQFARARQRALEHPLIAGQLLSEDGQTLLIFIKLDWLFVEGDQETVETLKSTVTKTADRFPELNIDVQVAGRVPTTVAILESRDRNEKRFVWIALGMVTVLATILFRGLASVLIVSAPPIIGVYWSLGALPLFELQDNPFNQIVTPVLIGMVGFTDSIHLFLDIRRLRSNGMTSREAAKQGVIRVGLACFLTSLTTAIGLGSLALAENEVVREFGMSCVMGVGLSFLAVLLVIPLASASKLGDRIQTASKENVVDRHLARIGPLIDWTIRHHRPMGMVAIGGTVALLLVSLQMNPDQRVAMLLPTGSPALKAMETLDESMGGTETATVQVDWSKSVPRGSEEIRMVIAEAQAILDEEELIGSPVSLQRFIDVLPGDPDAAGRLSITELLPPPLKHAFYKPDDNSAVVRFKIRDVGIAAYAPVFKRIDERLNGVMEEHPDFNLYLSGRPIGRWKNLYQVVLDLVYSLGSASVIIFVVLTIAFRSLRLGLIAIVPNTFPLAFTGACFYWMGQSLEIAAVCAFTVCLGIAVDDTIHFLSRYRTDSEQMDQDDAIRSAFVSTGSALIMTTVILVLGISSVLISGMREQRIFALITCLTIGSALLGDLLLLPPLLAWFGKSKRDTEGTSEMPVVTEGDVRSTE
ncbi:efflux RND transporter permease subunit [Roseiconus lacunae]|uniref:MMPL family transporter n=1 Tax=Roseiconus lacunae TaxID=2605694 RepID=A0ABT7PQ08_9BACT|nr:MMPL family transporter [Roseiconus lacunae]MDM4018584.1 MMPL family transporter [Roseiconus lacunae]